MRPRRPCLRHSDDYDDDYDDYDDSEDDDGDNLSYRFARMGYTENMALTHKFSGNPCLDFFFHVVPDTPPESIRKRLELSWDHDPVKTLQLICNLRGVRGTGKSDKEGFYTCALWLHENHSRTLACNLSAIAEFGYFKDLPEIIYRLIEGPDVRKERKEAWRSGKKGKLVVCRRPYFRRQVLSGRDGKALARKSYFLMRKRLSSQKDRDEKRLLRARVPREVRIEANMVKVHEEKEKARSLRKKKTLQMKKSAKERYDTDEKYRFLHDRVSEVFAEVLRSDVEALASGDMKKISLAAKWCPSVDSSYDKATPLCNSIARMMFPRESLEEYANLEEDQYYSTVKNRLRKEVLVPLHQALKLPEVYMSAKQWDSVAYERVASVAMRNYTDTFLYRDNKRFKEYLGNVYSGDAKIAAGALLPHEIIEKNTNGSSGAAIVSELQWKRLVDDMLEKGTLSNCLAVCDVSGSMSGTPMEVSVALGLLVSELSEEPWKGHVITFSRDPQLHLIKPGNLKSKTDFIRKMEWGMNTDFEKVFDRILEVAVGEKLSEDQMIKRLFVFSDMEFDQASAGPWETNYTTIRNKYRKNGYKDVPEIVFWNLRDSSATPVTATQNGVALVSGFSKNLLTLFLEQGGVINPEDVIGEEENQESSSQKPDMNPEATMQAAISSELYQKLAVYD